MKPMLAYKYEDYKHRLQFPVAVQPKLNGVRMTAAPKGIVSSRNEKPVLVSKELEQAIKRIGLDLDGELFKKGKDLAKIYGNAKRLVSLVQDFESEYHIFDLPIQEPFSRRMLSMIKIKESRLLKVVPTYIAKNEQEVMDWFDVFITDGYEGIIVRSLHALYQYRRTPDLLKLKKWIYVTGTIIGFAEGEGDFTGTLGAFHVETPDFICYVGSGPGLDHALRHKCWASRKKLLHTIIKFRYQELTHLGNPRSPIFEGLGNAQTKRRR